MLYFTLLLCLVATLHSSRADEELAWRDWKAKFAHIGRGDDDLRRSIFHRIYSFVNEHNKRYKSNEITYEVELNQFAASPVEELRRTRLGYKPSLAPMFDDAPDNSTEIDEPENVTLLQASTSLDWRSKGAVTAPKDQGECGACWAFSATGAIEGRTFLKTKKLVSLSEQNLMDCSRSLGNQGCNGGLSNTAFRYVQKSGGLNTESSYPYNGRDSSQCKFKKASAQSPIKSFQKVAANEQALMQAVNKGPVSVAFDVEDALYYYKSGIYTDRTCRKGMNDLNHAVLLVGYGTDGSGRDYWLVKNSWGSGWGERGYFRVPRGSNMCGIATDASYPVV